MAPPCMRCVLGAAWAGQAARGASLLSPPCALRTTRPAALRTSGVLNSRNAYPLVTPSGVLGMNTARAGRRAGGGWGHGGANWAPHGQRSMPAPCPQAACGRAGGNPQARSIVGSSRDRLTILHVADLAVNVPGQDIHQLLVLVLPNLGQVVNDCRGARRAVSCAHTRQGQAAAFVWRPPMTVPKPVSVSISSSSSSSLLSIPMSSPSGSMSSATSNPSKGKPGG